MNDFGLVTVIVGLVHQLISVLFLING